jgi:DNA polymerase-3 subunit epsilon
MGARPTEIAVILVNNDKIIDRYQSLMNPETYIPSDIQVLTGITNEMVQNAPSVGDVMKQAAKFVCNYPIVAHNAAFDQKFWNAELQKIKLSHHNKFICSLLLARRIFPDYPNHRLGTLIQMLQLPNTGRSHRALADAESTTLLLQRIKMELKSRFRLSQISPELLLAIQGKSRKQLESCINNFR